MKKTNNLSMLTAFALMFLAGLMGPVTAFGAGPTAIDLLSANNFVILTKTGISDTGSHTSAITGNIGSSPITAASMSNVFCSQITGTIYGVDAAYVGSGNQTCFAGNPPLSNKTLVDNAVLDMGTAYADAAGRTNPTATELGAGNIGGMTLAPGLYKWGTDVTIPTSVTLSGSANDVWIFQIAGNLSVASAGSVPAGTKIILAGGAQASNVFWQVGGVTGATLGTYSTFNGTILTAKAVIIETGAVLNGRALAQTQVTLDATIASIPPSPPPEVVTVTIAKYVDGHKATVVNTQSLTFPMVSTTTSSNQNAGAQSTGTYQLSSTNSYEAVTSDMAPGADYATNEIVGGSVVGANCTTGQPFSLVGYTSGNTLALARAALPTATPPSFTGLAGNKYVIVWNHDCSQATEGVLRVTSVDSVQTTATADGQFAHGWKYTFNITVPTNERNLAMKFANWNSAIGSSVIPAAHNIQISSAEADNAGAVIPITSADTYSTPTLHITGDLDPNAPGLQVKVMVQVKIPTNTANGSYTTSYGVQTLP